MSIYQNGGTANGRRLLTLTSPITLETTGEIICANQADVSAAVSTAREIQPTWSKTSFSQRAAIVNGACRLIVKKADMIMDTVIAETGKARTDND